MSPPRPSRARSVRTAAVLVVVTFAVLAWTLSVGPTVAGTFRPTASHVGPTEVVSAEQSLQGGDGPAGGLPWTCSGAGALSAHCGPASLAHPGTAPVVSWTNVSALVTPNPGTWVEGAMTWDASDGYVLLWGGAFGSAGLVYHYDETWTYFSGTWTNVTARVTGGHPNGALLPSLAYDPSSGVVVEFGGETYNGATEVNTTWTYHDLAWTNVTASAGPAPSPRIYPGFAEDSTDGFALLFGGSTVGGTANSNDTWEFQDGRWTNITSSALFPTPGFCEYPLMADDPAGLGALMICISHGTGIRYAEDTYKFEAGGWINLTASVTGLSFPPPVFASLAWSGQGYAVVLSTEIAANPSSGVEGVYRSFWSFANNVWTNLSSQLIPASTMYSGMAPADHGTVLLYGGFYFTSSSITLQDWTYLYSAPLRTGPLSASPAVTDVGLTVSFDAAPQFGAGTTTGNFTFGDGSYFVGNSSNATHAYSRAGVYLANYTGTDWLGSNVTASTVVVVNPDVNVVAVVASATSVDTGTDVVMAANVTGGTGPFTYVWTFGDGTIVSEATPIHNWTKSGTFNVTVTVYDSVGSHAMGTLAVKVSNPPSSGFSWTRGTGLIALLVLVAFGVAVVSVLGTLLATRRRRGPGGPARPPKSEGPPTGATESPLPMISSPVPEEPPWRETPPPSS